MKEYIIPFIAYLAVIPILGLFFDPRIAYAVNALIGIFFLILFYKKYNLKFRFDLIGIITGIVIFLLWLITVKLFPPLYSIKYYPSNTFFLVSKLVGFILVAPFIEELFTRGFLIRILVDKNWKKVPIGKYTLSSCIITVLFFGFSHNMWVSGLIAGIIFNVLLYKQKRIESCIIAHVVANLVLAIYIIATSSWYLW